MKEQETVLLSVAAWKQKAKSGEDVSNVGLIKTFVPEELKIDDTHQDGLSRVKFVISTASRDRDADTVSVKGWQLENYQKNPVVLFAHDHRGLPIGQSVEIGTEKGKLTSVVRLDTDIAEHPLPRTVLSLLRRGTLRAASVGFVPMSWNEADPNTLEDYQKGNFALDFTKQELVEWSIVPVPSNPEALMQARSAGVDIAPVVNWAGEVLEAFGGAARAGLWVPRKVLEQVAKIGSPTILCSPEGGWTVEPAKKEESPRPEPPKPPEPPKEEPKVVELEDEVEAAIQPESVLSDFDRMTSIVREHHERAFACIDGVAVALSGAVERTVEKDEWAVVICDKLFNNGIVRDLPGVDRAGAVEFAIRAVEQRKSADIFAIVALRYGTGAEDCALYMEQVQLSWKEEAKKEATTDNHHGPVTVASAKDVIEAMGLALGPALKKALAEVTGRVDE